jgi:hypothetical protein
MLRSGNASYFRSNDRRITSLRPTQVKLARKDPISEVKYNQKTWRNGSSHGFNLGYHQGKREREKSDG